MEAWRDDACRALGISSPFVQMNVSTSVRGVLRGLHFQEPHPMVKLVFVLAGCIRDVAVDIRQGSPTFGHHWIAELSEENRNQVLIPHGFAHGFEVMSETATIAYLVTERYLPEADRAIRWNDPDLGIPWQTKDPVLSNRDTTACFLREATFLPTFQTTGNE